MAKKVVKMTKLKVGTLVKLLIILCCIVLVSFLTYLYIKLPIKNLIVLNNNYLSDDYVLEKADLIDYPSFWLNNLSKSKKSLEKDSYIKKVKIKRKFFHKVVIDIEERRALFSKEFDGKIVFDDSNEVEENKNINFRIPRLLNYVPDDKYASFIKGMKIIDEDILTKISDIEYVPNELDKDRFLLYMDDSNMVYLTLTKFKMINYYNDVLSQLEERHGILYLDNGNHFQIRE